MAFNCYNSGADLEIGKDVTVEVLEPGYETVWPNHKKVVCLSVWPVDLEMAAEEAKELSKLLLAAASMIDGQAV